MDLRVVTTTGYRAVNAESVACNVGIDGALIEGKATKTCFLQDKSEAAGITLTSGTCPRC